MSKPGNGTPSWDRSEVGMAAWADPDPTRALNDLTHGDAFLTRMGWHVRSLRKVRGLSQEKLAEACALSADTVRRLEHGAFSPSIGTLRRLTSGLEISLSYFFDSLEIGELVIEVEILQLLSTRSRADHELALPVLRALFDSLDRRRG